MSFDCQTSSIQIISFFNLQFEKKNSNLEKEKKKKFTVLDQKKKMALPTIQQQQQIKHWIEVVTQSKLDEDLIASLKSGVVLCK